MPQQTVNASRSCTAEASCDLIIASTVDWRDTEEPGALYVVVWVVWTLQCNFSHETAKYSLQRALLSSFSLECDVNVGLAAPPLASYLTWHNLTCDPLNALTSLGIPALQLYSITLVCLWTTNTRSFLLVNPLALQNLIDHSFGYIQITATYLIT